jgi:putative acetyltransferase
MQIRAFEIKDEDGVDALLKAAFPGPEEARLVIALRAADADTLELVADDHGRIVGTVMFSPVTTRVEDGDDLFGVGLGPVAVMPEHQSRGIGTALIEAGIDYLATLGVPWCVLLGDPDYYQRFDFKPAASWNWSWAGDPDGAYAPAFQVRPLITGSAPSGKVATVHYHPAFLGV